MGFGFTATQCPGIANFQGTDVEGWTPVPIEMGSVSSTALAALSGNAVFLILTGTGLGIGMAGYAGYKTYQQVAVWLESFEDSSVRMVAAYTDCFEKAVKAGMPATQASTACQNVQASAQSFSLEQLKAKIAASGWGLWTWVAVGGGVLVAGGILALYLRNRVSSALGPVRVVVPGMGDAEAGLCECGSRNHKIRHRGRALLLDDLYPYSRKY